MGVSGDVGATGMVAMRRSVQEDHLKIVNNGERRRDMEYLLLGTWNIRGSFEEGKLKHLIRECSKYHFDIVALQETKQLGQNTIEIGDYLMFNSWGKIEH